MRARGRCGDRVIPFRPVTARTEVPSSFRSSSARPGPLALIRQGVTETLARRRLIAYLVRADLRKTGADTLLGNLWWVLDPLLQMLVYYLLVGVILGRDRYPDFPLFIFAAILPWKWFDATVKDGLRSVVSQERLIKQIWFPKLVLPVSASLSGVVSFAFGLIPLTLIMAVFYQHRITPWLLLIPVIAVVQLVFATAMAIAISGLNVFYRDIANAARHLMRFWFYLSPTLYGIADIERITRDKPGIGQLIDAWYAVNPFSYLLGSYRNVIYEGTHPDWLALAVLLGASLVFLALAILLFKRLEPSFAKIL
jgi:lipopolysaccharide transport system permease protein/teichoic acid transport system permease protein